MHSSARQWESCGMIPSHIDNLFLYFYLGVGVGGSVIKHIIQPLVHLHVGSIVIAQILSGHLTALVILDGLLISFN